MRTTSTVRLLTLLLLGLMLSGCANNALTENSQAVPLNVDYWPHSNVVTTPLPQLRVASINLAHGRKNALNQLLVSSTTTRQNLLDIAAYLKQQNIDVVALQEADASSAWSGSFNHVEYIAQHAGYSWYAHSLHSTGKLANYGTAILSKYPISEAYAYHFMPTPPTTTKGFTAAKIHITATQSVDVVSLHLDFSRASKRRQQMAELRERFNQHEGSAIIMGDFNSEWEKDEGVVSQFENNSRYRVYQPQSSQLASYKNKRLDWIFISKDLQFINYELGPNTLSDHRPVISLIKLSETLNSSQ
ncbi:MULTISPECIES: endonuclease/exonuclease/phosphatase family protein [unclassified Agarivorans]|uniref:endonuclease/exonuclease/phosphatase family protein n=1 Tax=unclassified Agarivorans TaxID=2636026 RepID=UPI0026E34E3C|nr:MULTISPECIES: endonuclease/exonuclease/phosphatase family protein [unclassified Agarivorans]MDO6687449.1 endonuclease/exonuclease/phosphatase family protein [Agarivorans sp. 3_MG-2023]MDO6715215.1 endonuclease/exonuclease/phosphatase family protein [Agarivorans sp. 2_MG-2023]